MNDQIQKAINDTIAALDSEAAKDEEIAKALKEHLLFLLKEQQSRLES